MEEKIKKVTVEDVQKKKKILEFNIENLIKNFQSDTGVQVEDIVFRRRSVIMDAKEGCFDSVFSVSVKVEL